MSRTYAETFAGSVSHGTMRPEDLIPVFVGTLSDALEHPGNAETHIGAKTAARMQERLTDIESAMQERRGTYFDSDDAAEDLSFLFDALNEMAPRGTYFGAHEGDGSDYGFWTVEPPDLDGSDDICPCGDPECSRPFGHMEG